MSDLAYAEHQHRHHHRSRQAQAKAEVVVLEASQNEEKPIPKLPRPVKLIVIDPGHGGTNEGALGKAQIHEKYLSLQVAQLLADRIRSELPGIEVVLTRNRDVSMLLTERIAVGNRLDADLFMSIHFNNSANSEAIGYESFWAGDYWISDMEKAGIEITPEIRMKRESAGARAEHFAHLFNRAMHHQFTVLDRGVKPGDYTVLTRAEVPSVVLELGFLSHAEEGLDVLDKRHRAKFVEALMVAVKKYVSGQ